MNFHDAAKPTIGDTEVVTVSDYTEEFGNIVGKLIHEYGNVHCRITDFTKPIQVGGVWLTLKNVDGDPYIEIMQAQGHKLADKIAAILRSMPGVSFNIEIVSLG